MTNSVGDLKEAKALLIIGSNTTEQHPIIGLEIRKALSQGTKLIVADPRKIDLAERATLHLRHKPGTDIALLNGLAHIILQEGLHDEAFVARRTENFDEWRAAIERYTPDKVSEITGIPVDELYAAARMYGSAKPAALLYAMGITQHISGHQNVLACANLQMLTGNMGVPGGGVNPLRGQNNVQGACDMGALVNVFPGYQAVTDEVARAKFEEGWGCQLPGKPGLTVVEMLNAASEGKLKGLYILGENVVVSDPDSNHVVEALKALDFLVVQEIFLSDTALLADVVLPGVSFAEKLGTFTNTERRVQLVRPAIPSVGDSRPDWWIIAELAKRMTAASNAWEYSGPAQIMEELASFTPIYGAISHERLANAGLQWPCPTPDHPGTPILHVDKFSRGLGRFTPVEYIPAAELPDEQYPLILTTGRVLEHFHTGTLTRRVAGLATLVPEERIRMHPTDAAQRELLDGDWALISSRRGQVKARVQVTEESPPGVVFMTFHFAEANANRLTNPALDPTAKIPEFKVCAVQVERVNGK
jgi:formate dehydrogenase alpha subunit